MPRIDYQELKGLSDELTSLRQSIVSYLKEYNRANDHFVEENELQGQAWSSAKSYHRNYKTISDSIFNALYDLDDTLKAYLATFKSLVGEAENRLDTDELQDLQNQLRQLQTQKLDFMEEMAKVFKDVPVLKEFFGQQSMYGKMKEIELLKRYEQFEKQTQGNFDNVHETLRAILQGLAYLGDSKNFESGANGYHALNLNSLEWYQTLEKYNSENKEDHYEIKEIKTKYGTFYQILKNGKVQKEATEALQKSKLMESVDMMAQLTPEILKILMGIDDIEVLMDDGSTKVQKAGASFWLLLSVLPPDKIKDIIKSAKLAKKAGKGLDGIHLTEKEWKNFKALDKTGDTIKAFKWEGKSIKAIANNLTPNELIQQLEKKGWQKSIEQGGSKSGVATIFINPSTGEKIRIHANPGYGIPYFRVQNSGGNYVDASGVFPSNATRQEVRELTHFYFKNLN